MERPITNHPFKSGRFNEVHFKGRNDTEDLNEHVRKFIEELERGSTPQKAAEHAENFRNNRINYLLEKLRHKNYWAENT